MASKTATLQINSEIYFWFQECCRLFVTSFLFNNIVGRQSPTEDYVKWVAQESTLVVLTTRKIERASEYEAEFRSVRECLLNGMRWNSRSICLVRAGGTRIVILKQLHPGIVAMKQRYEPKCFD